MQMRTTVDSQHSKKLNGRISILPKISASLSAFKKSAQFINSFLRYRFWGLLNQKAMAIFNAATQEKLNQLFAFLNLYQHAKNAYSNCSFLRYSQFYEFCNQTGHTHFWPCQPKNILISLYFFPICINMQKTVYSICSFFRLNFRDPLTDWPHPFLTMSTKKYFNQLVFFSNLYQHAKNSLFHLFILQIKFQRPLNRLVTPIFDYVYSQNFQLPFNLHEFVPVSKKIVNFIISFLRYGQF